MNNLIEMFKKFSGNLNPQQLVMNMMKQNSNPVISNLIEMANKGDTKGVENFARNYFKEHGQDFDKEFSNFMSNFKK